METEKTPNAKKTNPVYISVPKLERLLEIASTYSEKSFNPAYFENYGFGNSDSALAVSSLRFLGVVDDEGTPTELMEKIRYKDEVKKREGFTEVVQKAYAKLFQLDKPYDLTPARLFDEMRGQYGISPRAARAAVPAFLKLCEYAGLKEKTKTSSVRNRKREGTATSRIVATRAKKEENQYAGMNIIVVESGKAIIGIPEGYIEKSVLDTTLRDRLDNFIKAARVFAEPLKEEKRQVENTEEIK